MSRRIVFIVACVFLLLVVSGIGTAGYLLGRPIQGGGGGQSRPSPDGKWVAHAFSMEEWSLLGGTRQFTELWVEAKGRSGGKSGAVRRMRVEDTAEPGIDWRIEGEVFWSRNGAVTFKAVTGKANLDVTWRDF